MKWCDYARIHIYTTFIMWKRIWEDKKIYSLFLLSLFLILVSSASSPIFGKRGWWANRIMYVHQNRPNQSNSIRFVLFHIVNIHNVICGWFYIRKGSHHIIYTSLCLLVGFIRLLLMMRMMTTTMVLAVGAPVLNWCSVSVLTYSNLNFPHHRWSSSRYIIHNQTVMLTDLQSLTISISVFWRRLTI